MGTPCVVCIDAPNRVAGVASNSVCGCLWCGLRRQPSPIRPIAPAVGILASARCQQEQVSMPGKITPVAAGGCRPLWERNLRCHTPPLFRFLKRENRHPCWP